MEPMEVNRYSTEPMDMGGYSTALATILRGSERSPGTVLEARFEQSDDQKFWSTCSGICSDTAAIREILPETEVCVVFQLSKRWLRLSFALLGGSASVRFTIVPRERHGA